MFSSTSVCLFACQHDNFRTIKHRMMKLGGQLQCTKVSLEFQCPGQRSRSPGDKKTKKCGIWFGSRRLGCSPRAAFFSGAVLGGAVHYAGEKFSACCLGFFAYVFNICLFAIHKIFNNRSNNSVVKVYTAFFAFNSKRALLCYSPALLVFWIKETINHRLHHLYIVTLMLISSYRG